MKLFCFLNICPIFAWPRGFFFFNPLKGPFNGCFNMTTSLCGGLWEATIMSSPFTAKVVSSHSVRIFGVESYEKKKIRHLFVREQNTCTVLLSQRTFKWPARRKPPIPNLTMKSPPTKDHGDIGYPNLEVALNHSRIRARPWRSLGLGLCRKRPGASVRLECPEGQRRPSLHKWHRYP